MIAAALWRIAIVIVVIVIAFLVVGIWTRRRGRSVKTTLPPGITIVIGPDCRLCRPAIDAIHHVDPAIDYNVVDLEKEDADTGGLPVKAVPTVVVVDGKGRVLVRRSGHAAINDAAYIVRSARKLAGVARS